MFRQCILMVKNHRFHQVHELEKFQNKNYIDKSMILLIFE
jgi:hypothetical protein